MGCYRAQRAAACSHDQAFVYLEGYEKESATYVGPQEFASRSYASHQGCESRTYDDHQGSASLNESEAALTARAA